MPRGTNPKSHHNKPIVQDGVNSTITLTKSQWAFLRQIGQGNKSKGGREVVRAMQIIAERNWKEAASVLKLDNPELMADSLLQHYPALAKGRKTHKDLIQELALGECCLAQQESKIIRVVNLVTISVLDGNRKLIESYQKLASGEIFPRNIEGVAEKIQYPETPSEAAYRGLEEELGVRPVTLDFISETFEKNQKSKYEGIESYAHKYAFKALLKPEDIKEEYQEFREGDLTVFNWVTA